MSDRGIFQGYALQQVDQKGRVAIPAALRDTLVGNNLRDDDDRPAPVVVISTHESDRCLIGYDSAFARERHRALLARQAEFAGTNGAVNHNIMRDGLGAAEQLPYDGSGRFILPAYPKSRARIDKYAFFFGVGDFFEIWDPKTLVECDTASEVMKDAARFFMAEKGIVL